MTSVGSAVQNLTAAVPLLMVTNMEQSLAFYSVLPRAVTLSPFIVTLPRAASMH
jgi:hypothetical protein